MIKKSTTKEETQESKDLCIKKRNHKVVSDLLNEYSKSSTLHGLRYITERELSYYEKTFWLITVLVSVSICLIVIINLYFQWKANPVIVTISENIVSASQIPFPSITICPQTKCRASIYNYTVARLISSTHLFSSASSIARALGRRKRSSNFDNSLVRFTNIATVCEGNAIITNLLARKDYYNAKSDAMLVKHLEQVAEPLEDVLFRCIWRGRKISCAKLFKNVLTREGICFNMNAKAVNEILKFDNLQKEYNYMDTHYTDKEGKPKFGRINGAGPDLDIVLKRNASDRDISCNTLNNGYKIYMQNPDDLPSTTLYHYSALDRESISLAVKCNILKTKDGLKENSPEERQCYFEGERNLTYFNTYSAHNCWLECVSKYMYKKCGCVGFYLPHNNSSELCNIVNYNCIINVEEELADMEASGQGCRCLPACYTVDYSAEASTSEFNYKTLWEIEYRTKFDNSFQYSRIVVFFQNPSYLAMQRSQLTGWIDFIAYCGGLLSLFLGFSILSIVEIMYYLTLRFWFKSGRDSKAEEKSQAIYNISN